METAMSDDLDQSRTLEAEHSKQVAREDRAPDRGKMHDHSAGQVREHEFAEQNFIKGRDLLQDRINELGRERERDLARMEMAIAEQGSRVAAAQAVENDALARQHEAKRQELVAVRTESAGKDVLKSPQADRQLSDSVRSAELSSLDRFQEAQREQLLERHRFEADTFARLAQDVADLRVRQQWREQTSNVERPNDGERMQVAEREDRWIAERQYMEGYAHRQIEALADNRQAVQERMRQDQAALQQALYGDASNAAARDFALRRVLDEQDAARQALTLQAEQRRNSLEAQHAFANRFSATAELKSVWERAARGKDNFEAARNAFWRQVNEGADRDATAVRRIIEAAGFQLQGGTRAPLLKEQGWSERSRELMEQAKDSGWFTRRELKDRVLEIDHAVAQSVDKSRGLDADNLRFMLGRDNAFRGNRHDDADRALQRESSEQALKKKHREQERESKGRAEYREVLWTRIHEEPKTRERDKERQNRFR
jgi:hypothetical protein